jgi:drug/metabolite transporter (DMT)-like permease
VTKNRPQLGIALIVLMAACFATMDTSAKYLGAFVPVLAMMWFRYLTQAVIMSVWLARSASSGFRARHPRFQVLRGCLLLATSSASFYGVQYLPVAEFTAINMLTPVVVTLLAGWVLHEHVSGLRWMLVGGGFLGALIVIRPGSGLFGWAVLFPLLGALSYASFQVLTSKLAALESPFTTHFYTGLTGTLILTPVLFLSPIDLVGLVQSTRPEHLALMLGIGLMGTTGHLLLILALGYAPTATLMPFVYVQIAAAAVVSWLVFRHVPDGWAWVGMAVIALCGAASAWMNVRQATPPASPVSADTIAG